MTLSYVAHHQPAANDEAILRPRQSDGIVYYPSAFLHAAMPVREPESGSTWERSSKTVSLRLTSGFDASAQELGLPYGTLARLLLTWVSTEVKRTGSPEIRLGSDVGTFMWSLGLGIDYLSGGANGGITRLKDQLRRLFGCRARIERRTDGVMTSGVAWTADPDLLENPVGSVLSLSDFFMTELAHHAVPVDGRTLMGLSRSALSMDMYCWLTWRFSYLRAEQKVDWEQLQLQFGMQTKSSRKFKETFKVALDRVRAVYPGIRVAAAASYLSLAPSPTSVAKLRR